MNNIFAQICDLLRLLLGTIMLVLSIVQLHGARAMSDLVQCKRKPPVLVPLRDPVNQRRDKIVARIQLITNYAERYRELDDIEAREYLNLKHILEHGVEKPKGHWFPGMQKKVFEKTEIADALALLD